MDKNLLGIALAALVVSVICLQGCTQDVIPPAYQTPTPIVTPTAIATPTITPNGTVANGSVGSVVNASNRFAFDLYSRYKSEDGNVFFSPYSISTALAMTYEGARGQTAEEMQSVFHFPTNESERRGGFLQLHNSMNEPGKSYNLSTANALWAQKDYRFLPSYFDLIKTYYGGNVTNLDFAGDAENSRLTINNWVAGKTDDKIRDIIPPGAIDGSTRLVITNAVYFKAKWYIPFLNATDGDFRVGPGRTVTAKMMPLYGDDATTYDGSRTDLAFNYAETDEAQIIELPYVGNETSMLVILPKEDSLQALEQSLTPGRLDQWKAVMNVTEMEGVQMPRFKFTTDYMMPDTLKSMGMEKAFDPSQADFSGMDGSRNLYISEVIHKAFVDVNETGTEAAAATVVIMTETAIDPHSKPVFRADHPFIFIIQQRETGNILFMGRISDPTAG